MFSNHQSGLPVPQFDSQYQPPSNHGLNQQSFASAQIKVQNITLLDQNQQYGMRVNPQCQNDMYLLKRTDEHTTNIVMALSTVDAIKEQTNVKKEGKRVRSFSFSDEYSTEDSNLFEPNSSSQETSRSEEDKKIIKILPETRSIPRQKRRLGLKKIKGKTLTPKKLSRRSRQRRPTADDLVSGLEKLNLNPNREMVCTYIEKQLPTSRHLQQAAIDGFSPLNLLCEIQNTQIYTLSELNSKVINKLNRMQGGELVFELEIQSSKTRFLPDFKETVFKESAEDCFRTQSIQQQVTHQKPLVVKCKRCQLRLVFSPKELLVSGLYQQASQGQQQQYFLSKKMGIGSHLTHN